MTDELHQSRRPRQPAYAALLGAGLLALLFAGDCSPRTEARPVQPGAENRMLVMVSAPSIDDPYYREHFAAFLRFYTDFARAARDHDHFIVLADAETLPRLRGKIPDRQLLEAKVADVWVRDFGTLHPRRMVQFRYDRPREAFIQKSFRDFARRRGLRFEQSSLKIDGGNFVDNGGDAAIMTDKIYARNPGIAPGQLRAQLRKTLGLKHLAIIPMDDEYLGHSDGMVLFASPNTVLMNEYADDPEFTEEVEAALRTALPGFQIHRVPGAGYGEKYGRYASACGIYVNATVTDNAIYVPVFDDASADRAALNAIRARTQKAVVPVPAGEICELGGSVRCLSSQLSGENARRLLAAARAR